ncbi:MULTISPECIES: response regulator transcription factor [unclassified Thiobacillus]|uniref:response regulator n=1 Tax=unclassified Thiobacillus TaxID=2646513 RepID=UPI00086B30E7|nr:MULTISPECIES: response regulator transcription factor [unclassified Thiobacillus]MBD3811692.1 response regulator transcription factor [Betaproteobacteria bacterium]OGU40744.1 MAG: DNA-binding response regulator [Hydrogenophilales bacterium RIFOXYA1_FULL_63_33]MBC2730158.1 response regulator transcription factor [Thiobacillus sp.]MBC2738896.1 response regulator transcription factor [Thiobacillus sp.]MBC2760814.1 response regulator transcription factor [Thiobacillus sp.]
MKTLLADDHPLMREGVRQVLSQLEPPVEIIDAHDYPSLFAQTALHTDLDLALVDLNMPGFVGMQGITQYRSRFPDIPLVVLSASESPHDIRNALEAGALGYIPKAASTAVMLSALRQVLAGNIFVPACLGDGNGGLHTVVPADFEALQHSGLTARQLEVARLLAQGCANKAIAGMLAMSESTVKVHIAAIFRALDVTNRTEAVLAIQRLTHNS